MEEMKFDELLVNIEKIIKDLESGNIDLETSIEKYSEAMKMIKIKQLKVLIKYLMKMEI